VTAQERPWERRFDAALGVSASVILFVLMMGVGMLWNVAGTVFSFMVFTDMPPPPPTANAFAASFSLMTNLMLGLNVLATIAFAVLFGWIVKRLLSPEIRSEFT